MRRTLALIGHECTTPPLSVQRLLSDDYGGEQLKKIEKIKKITYFCKNK